jgi:MFS family permease
MGFFIAPIEALPEISVTDIYFTHQRGTYMGIYSFALAGSNYFAPVICGFIAERQGWQWVFYWPAIFNAFAFVFLFFFMEESNYTRKTADVVIAPVTIPAEPKGDSVDEEKAQSMRSPSATSIDVGTATKSFTQKLSIWQPTPGQSMFERAKRSLKYLSWPVIAYCGFSYGSYLILFNILNATASIILGGPPYSMYWKTSRKFICLLSIFRLQRFHGWSQLPQLCHWCHCGISHKRTA